MQLAIVTFRMPAGFSREDAAGYFRETAPRYAGLPGLLTKHYIHRALTDHAEAGGAYLWASAAAAGAGHGPEWAARVTAKYGSAPEIRIFDVPLSVDNRGESPIIAEHPPA